MLIKHDIAHTFKMVYYPFISYNKNHNTKCIQLYNALYYALYKAFVITYLRPIYQIKLLIV